MNDPKPTPSVEKSLNSISWHLKTLVEELKKMREHLTGSSSPDMF